MHEGVAMLGVGDEGFVCVVVVVDDYSCDAATGGGGCGTRGVGDAGVGGFVGVEAEGVEACGGWEFVFEFFGVGGRGFL